MTRSLLIFFLTLGYCLAGTSVIDSSARKFIDAGNVAWVNGMKTGDVTSIAATYAEEALDCGPTGECRKGRPAIYDYLKRRIERLGRAESAGVTSTGSVQQGDFVYEWGVAKVSFSDGRKVEGRYLTVWQLQRDGTWRIFRNISIPDDRRK